MNRRVWVLLVSFLYFSSVSCSKLDTYEDIIADIQLPCDSDSLVYSYQKFMSLQPTGNKGVQGSACYGDYFVQGYESNSYITLYNLKEKKILTTIDIPAPSASSRIHVNTMNFGSQRCQKEDYFPLLYVCSGYATDGVSYIYVYRLTEGKREDGLEFFDISLVQTISLCGFGGWTDGIVDAEHNRLWVKSNMAGQYVYDCYEMPLIEDGDVNVYYDNYIKEFVLDREPLGSRNQGHLFINDRIILVSGVPTSSEPLAFVSINTLTGKRELVVDLASIGLVNPDNKRDSNFEPESVIIYNGQIILCYPRSLYLFEIERVRNTRIAETLKDNDSRRKVYNSGGVLRTGDKKGVSIIKQSNGVSRCVIK